MQAPPLSVLETDLELFWWYVWCCGLVEMSVFPPDSVPLPVRFSSSLICPFMFPSKTCNGSLLFEENQPHIMMLPLSEPGIICTTLLSPNMNSWIIAKGLYFCFIFCSKSVLICLNVHGQFLNTYKCFFFFLAVEFYVECQNGDASGGSLWLLFSV